MDRMYCEYCHGYTVTSEKGNCVACGAPRGRNNAPSYLPIETYMSATTDPPYTDLTSTDADISDEIAQQMYQRNFMDWWNRRNR